MAGFSSQDPRPSSVRRQRRESSRALVHLVVEIETTDGAKVEGVASDLSLTGMFAYVPKSLAIGTPVRIRVRLPGLNDAAEIEATVRWLKGDAGIGLQFGLLSAAETHAIVQLLAQARAAQATHA